MSKLVVDTRGVKSAAAILLSIQRTRRKFAKQLKQLQSALPGLDPDEVHDLAVNKQSPGRWLSQSSVAVERQLCSELGIKPTLVDENPRPHSNHYRRPR